MFLRLLCGIVDGAGGVDGGEGEGSHYASFGKKYSLVHLNIVKM